MDAPGSSPASLEIELLEERKLESKKLYAIKFCLNIPSLSCYFATAGGNTVIICRTSSSGIEVVQRHVDSNSSGSSMEDYWACCWAAVSPSLPVVVAAGSMGILRVISVMDLGVVTLIGHGDSVNELITHPVDSHLVFSASKDRSVRLWNLRSMICVAVFGGDKGHRDDVLSIDVHTLGNVLASSGVDTSIKLWNLRDPGLVAGIARSDEYVKDAPDALSFPVLFMQAPLFSTNRIHRGYVDSVRWIGDFLLTKSTNSRMVLWGPDASRYKDAPVILQEYLLKQCDIWFIRSDVCVPLGLAAAGSNTGKVHLFSVGGAPSRFQEVPPLTPEATSPHKICERFQYAHASVPLCSLGTPEIHGTVRQTAFSADGRFLVFCLEDGHVQLWRLYR